MPDKDQIMRAIREGLDSLELTTSDGNSVWTKAIATKLCKIGKGSDFKYEVGAEVKEENRNWGEWLYDEPFAKFAAGQVVLPANLILCS